MGAGGRAVRWVWDGHGGARSASAGPAASSSLGPDLYHYPAERSSQRPSPRGAGGRAVRIPPSGAVCASLVLMARWTHVEFSPAGRVRCLALVATGGVAHPRGAPDRRWGRSGPAGRSVLPPRATHTRSGISREGYNLKSKYVMKYPDQNLEPISLSANNNKKLIIQIPSRKHGIESV
jgi:hypothetical protein